MLKPNIQVIFWKEPQVGPVPAWGSVPLEVEYPEGKATGERYTIRLKAEKSLSSISLAAEFLDSLWERSDYLLVPAAVYDGNRFRIRKVPYPPMFTPGDRELDPPVTVTDVPHFSSSPVSSGVFPKVPK